MFEKDEIYGSECDMSASAISVSEAKEMLDRGDKPVFVDSRNPDAWGSSKEKIPGAIRVPVDEVADHLGEIPRDRMAITYCT